MKKNIFYLGVIQVLRFVAPLITFPYLTRVLGVESFGLLALCTGFISYLTLIVEFGFNKIAVAKIAECRSDKHSLTKYTSSIIFSQIFFYVIGVIIVLLTCLILKVSEDIIYILLALSLSSLGVIFTPTWLFLGLERMKELLPISLIGRVTTVPLVFFFVKDESDILNAAIIQSSAFVVSGIVSVYYVYKLKIIESVVFCLSSIVQVIRSSMYMFVTVFSSKMYMSAVPVIIGILLGPTSVGYYKVADNIKGIAMSLLSPIYEATYSRFNAVKKENYNEAVGLIRRYSLFSLMCALLGTTIIYYFAESIINLIAGEDYASSSFILKMMAVVILVSVVNQFLGVQTLISLGYSKEFSGIVFSGGITCLLIIVPSISYFGLTGAVMTVILSELFIMISLIIFHKVKKINVFIVSS